jgi:CRISPR-associated protein Csx17
MGTQGSGVLEPNKMGAMYYPALIKGFNSGQTFASKPDRRVNPWDFILLMEGTLLWASATTRRQLVTRQLASFPFFCRSSLGGADTLVTSEAEGSPGSPTRGELWCPLWDTPASIASLRALFSEGRLQLGERTCATALEFARAVARFGLERGVSAFTRFGLIERSGSGKQRTLLAVPLGRWAPRRLPHIELMDELDVFTDEVGVRLQHHENQPRRLLNGRARMERAVFNVASQPLGGRDDLPQRLLHVLAETAALERELGVRRGSVKRKVGQRLMEQRISPVQPVSLRWIEATEDRSVEFRLAHAVASIASWGDSRADNREPGVGPLRSNLLPLQYENGRWKWDDHSRSAVWARGAGLFDNLAAVLRRRLVEASRVTGKGLPLWSSNGAAFGDLLALWRGGVDEERIEDLIHALALVDFGARQGDSHRDERDASQDARSGDNGGEYEAEIGAAAALPRVYALLKLCFIGGRLPPRPTVAGSARRNGEEEVPPHAPEILNLLLAGRLGEALDTAARKLRAKGYPSVVPESAFRDGEFAMTAIETRRLAGLLLVPVRRPDALAALAIKPHAD